MSHRHTRSDSTVRAVARTAPPLSAGGPPATAALRGPGAALTVVLAVLLAMVLALAASGPAQAHDELVRTTPESGATLEKAPTTLDLTFSGSIQDIGSEVRVTDSHGTDMTRGKLAVQNTKVSQPLREGGSTDETYTVTWRVVSQDGHPIEGTFSYSVGEGSGTTAAPAPVASTSQGAGEASGDAGQQNVSGTGVPSWVLPVIGGVVALILLLVVLAFATRPRQR
ncbi:copper resistance protein CopC [Kocuria rhizophila]|uniref:copper resistance CopC family protein n=1 Tax=Kocuria rhizophila TaxID=72000 RepID=UPI001D40AA43|nr:copper resistance CopC family protein [Kocuria rhizophila]MCC5672709.1 copper resistance protein CopC [Kocuria rhizophila]MDV5998323.1 copper resistance protein CopC [Kocuria rhizophila]